jgi:hypothetical protein
MLRPPAVRRAAVRVACHIMFLRIATRDLDAYGFAQLTSHQFLTDARCPKEEWMRGDLHFEVIQ